MYKSDQDIIYAIFFLYKNNTKKNFEIGISNDVF